MPSQPSSDMALVVMYAVKRSNGTEVYTTCESYQLVKKASTLHWELFELNTTVVTPFFLFRSRFSQKKNFKVSYMVIEILFTLKRCKIDKEEIPALLWLYHDLRNSWRSKVRHVEVNDAVTLDITTCCMIQFYHLHCSLSYDINNVDIRPVR